MNLQKSSIVADIGSGTGISSEIFLENGNKVFGVEPNQTMREAAENYLADFENFISIDGTAENTTLKDQSVDFVVAGQSFHWFDETKARGEFKRVLKDKGYVALMWNERQLNTTPFLREYENFLCEFGFDYEKVRHDNISTESMRSFFQTDFQLATFRNVQNHDYQALKGRMLSSSYMPTEGSPRYAEMIKKLESLFAHYAENGRIDILYNTNIFYAQI